MVLDSMRERIAQAISPAKADQRNPDKLTYQSVVSNIPSSIPIYTDLTVRKATREGYKMSIYVYRAVRTIIQAASAVPWVVKNEDGEEIENHPFTLVMRRPNKEFSGQDLVELMIAHLELAGNAIWQPIYAGGEIKEIWPVMPDLVKPIPSDKPGEWLSGWEVFGRDNFRKTVPPDQFIHFLQVDPGNPYWGMSPLLAAARTVDADNEAQDTQKVSMQNRGIVDGVFVHESPLTEEQFEEARRQVREKFLDKTRRREPWVLGAGAKWQQMSLTPIEMDYIQSRLSNVRAIAAAFGIDPWWLGDRSSSTYNNVMEARKALYEDVVIPLLDDVKSTMNLRIAPLYEARYGKGEICYDVSTVPAMQGNFGEKVTQAQSLWNMGVPFSQINERLEMGFAEFEGWETGYLPMNLIPTGSEPMTIQESEPIEEEPEEGASYKAIDMQSEEQKAIHWKRIDQRRSGYWEPVARRVKKVYESEMDAILKSIRGADVNDLESIVGKAIKDVSPEWEKTITSTTVTIVKDFGEETLRDLTGKSNNPSEVKQRFDPFATESRKWIAKHAAESIVTIQKTSLSDVRNVILKGKENNLTTPEIATNIKQFYGDRSTYKSLRVARTEVAASAGFGQREAASQSGVVKAKKWLSSRDDRVRDSHLSLDGEERQLNEQYSNGLMFPGDTAGFPSELINCRCVEQYMSKKPDPVTQSTEFDPHTAPSQADITFKDPTGKDLAYINKEKEKINSMINKNEVSYDQWRALNNWKGSSREMRLIQTGKRVNPDAHMVKHVKDMEEALDVLPVYKGNVYRGLSNMTDDAMSQLAKAEYIEMDAMSSASASQRTASQFMSYTKWEGKVDSVLMEVRSGHKGVNIMSDKLKHADELEVVLKQGSKYRVAERRIETIKGSGLRFMRMILEEV